MRCSSVVATIALIALAWLPLSQAQQLVVEQGARWQLGDGTIAFDCATVQVAGSFDADDGQALAIGDMVIAGHASAAGGAIEVGGDWSNGGSFDAGTGLVRFSDACDRASATISGDSGFHNLSLESSGGKAYRFESGSTQTVASALQLTGAAGARMPISSTSAGERAELALDPMGSQQISAVVVSGMAAPAGSAWLAQGAPRNFDSVDAGNNLRWFIAGLVNAEPAIIPTTTPWSLALLGLALLALAMRFARLPSPSKTRKKRP